MQPIYLDNAATTPLAPEVGEAMRPWLEDAFGNPSSRHALGVRAAEALDEARWSVARALGAGPEGVVFTAGGTEANNLAVLGLARAAGSGHVLVGPTEHPSVDRAAQALADEGFDVERAALLPGGALDLDDLESKLRADTVLVAQMLANNEVGSVYPLAEVARRVRARAPRAMLHVDAVQGFGKLSVSLGELGADSVALSAHKLHGPKGAGVLALARGAVPKPLVFGGGQERGLRSGTENVAGIVGAARAIELAAAAAGEARRSYAAARGALRSGIEALVGARLLEPDGGAGVLDSIAAVRVPGPPAEVYQHHLEARGVLVGTGSACQSKKREISPALLAIGLDADAARHVLRFSFSRATTVDEVSAAARALAEVAELLARGAPAKR